MIARASLCTLHRCRVLGLDVSAMLFAQRVCVADGAQAPTTVTRYTLERVGRTIVINVVRRFAHLLRA